MKILVLVLLLFMPQAVALSPWTPSKCTNVLEFIEVLVPAEDRNVLIGQWKGFLDYNLRNDIITRAQYDERKIEILEAKRIIDELEAKGYKDNEVIGLAYHHYCSV